MTESTHFGSRQVPLADKQGLVDGVFHSVARRYDLMNDLMSFGLHRAWKDALVTAVDPPKDRPFALLDIAGGTGDVALRVIERGGAQTLATVCDINADMLEVGRERAAGARLRRRRHLRRSQRRSSAVRRPQLRCRDHRIWHSQCAAYRARAGGSPSGAQNRRQVCLPGILRVDVPGLDRLYDFYSFNVIPALGRMVTGDAESYRYLVESIRRFPQPQDFAAMLRAAGFARVAYKAMSGGIVALHSGWRL